MAADIVERAGIAGFRQCALRQCALLAGADHLAPKAEPAIDGADMHELEQHAIGIAMHDARDRRMRIIADRVRVLARRGNQLHCTRDELLRDGIGGIARLNQRGDLRRHRDGITRRDLFQVRQIGSAHQAVSDQLGRRAHCCCETALHP